MQHKTIMDKIIIQGARENNLKNIFLEIPKNQFVVFTGLSGSGKSTLAFDTLYAEGQRRYLESLSSYARQFLDKVGKPNVDKIEGLTPAIAIDQKTTSKNPRSTVGTITEIYDYLRLLFARVGEQFCPTCLEPISSMSASDIISQICHLEKNSKIIILAPIIKDKRGSFNDKLESLRLKGYVRAFVDGVMVRLDEEIHLHKTKKHTIEAVVDRVVINSENSSRIASAIEKALKESYGELEVEILQDNAPSIRKHYSEHKACFKCKMSFEELEPLSFSFNSPKGACESCLGLGTKFSLDISKILDPNTPLKQGAIKVIFGYNRSYYAQMFEGFCAYNGIDSALCFNELNKEQQDALLYGNGTEISFHFKNSPLKRPWKGIIQIAYDMFKEQKDLSDYMSEKTCSSCEGHRLKASSLSVQVAGLKMADFLTKPIEEVYHFFNDPTHFSYLNEQEKKIAEPILKEILERVFFYTMWG